MSDVEHQEALVAARDLGLTDRPTSALDAHCRRALQEEYERERRGIRSRVHARVRRSAVVPLGVLLACALGAVGYAALTTSSTPSAGIECHMDGNLDGGGTVTHLDGRSASETCAQLWAQGDIADGIRVPPGPLHACVPQDGSGAIHVFATADAGICSRVGLREVPTAGTDPNSHNYGRFASQLTDRLDSAAFACPSAAQARALVQGELSTNGLTGWTIKDAGAYDPQHPCASLALDSTSRTVTIVPSAR